RLADIERHMGHAGGEADPRQHGQVDDVVAHVAYILQGQACFAGQVLDGGDLVAHALQCRRDAQFGGPAGRDGALAAADPGPVDALLAQQAQAMAVQRVEGLDGCALFAVPEAAVGQDAVDVEHHHAHGAGPFPDRFRDAGQDLGFGGVGETGQFVHQMTFAARRSCMCRAPNNSPSPSSTSIWLSLCASMIEAASMAGASAAIERGWWLMPAETGRARISRCWAFMRRGAPSGTSPTGRRPSRTMAMPIPWEDISIRAAGIRVSGTTRGGAAPVRMMSATEVSSLRPRAPPGRERARSPRWRARPPTEATAMAARGA